MGACEYARNTTRESTKILTHKDNAAVEKELKAVKKIKDGYGSKELTTRLIHAITSIDGEEDRGKIPK